MIHSIEDFNLSGQCVFLRLDLNLPLKDGHITDETRLQAALPTIRYALDKGAKLVIASHLGRPKTEKDKVSLSLSPIAERISELLGVEVILIEEPSSEAPKALIGSLNSKKMILLENLRFDEDETKNGKGLSEAIAEYTDIYINDAFGASHRAHASIVGVPQKVAQKGIGFLIKKEVEMLDRIRRGDEHPYWAVLGGAKVSDKIDVIENLLGKVDGLIVGGAMAYTFLKAQNKEVGISLVEAEKVNFARDLIERCKVRRKELLLPIDHRVVKEFSAVETLQEVDEIPGDAMAIDIGPKTGALYANALQKAKMIFWNGPMGVFETKEYAKGTFAVARAIADNTGLTIVGGGDSAAAAAAAGLSSEFTHVSTGGGASLEFLQGIELPGLKALEVK